MKLSDIEIGLRVFNRGDMANIEHWGTVTSKKSSKWGDNIKITPDADSCDRDSYWIPAVMVNEVDKGNGLTRFVTEKAYNTLREQKMAEFYKFAKKAIKS